jgi:hypothetical protein
MRTPRASQAREKFAVAISRPRMATLILVKTGEYGFSSLGFARGAPAIDQNRPIGSRPL